MAGFAGGSPPVAECVHALRGVVGGAGHRGDPAGLVSAGSLRARRLRALVTGLPSDWPAGGRTDLRAHPRPRRNAPAVPTAALPDRDFRRAVAAVDRRSLGGDILSDAAAIGGELGGAG